MKQMMREKVTFKILRRVFILKVLILCCAVFYLNESEIEASSACFEQYEQCHNNCDQIPDPQQRQECKSNCLGPYGNCVNQAELDKEGEIISLYEEGQPMPLLQDFQMCLQNCTSCPLALYQTDPAAYHTCIENNLACKTACIAQF
jgi:hypothetical protein